MATPNPIFEYYRPFTTAINVSGGINNAVTSLVVDDASGFLVGSIIFIESEQLKITAISSNTLTVSREQNGTSAVPHANDIPVTVKWIKAITHADNSAVILCDITKSLNNPASAELILSNRSKDSSATNDDARGALSDHTGERASIFEEFQDCRIIDNESGLVLFRGRIYHVRNQYDFQYGNTVKLVLKDMLQELVDIPIDNAPPALREITMNITGARSAATKRSDIVSTVINGLSTNFDTTDATKFESSETAFTAEELALGTEDENGDSVWDIATGQSQALVLVNDFAKQDPHSGGEHFGYDYYTEPNRSSAFLNAIDPTVSLNYFKRGSRPATTINTHGLTLEYPSSNWGGQTNFRKAMLSDSEFTNPNGVFFTSMVAHFEDKGDEDATKRTIHGIESFELVKGNIPALLDDDSANDFPWTGKRIQYIEDGDIVTGNATRHETTGQSLQTDNPNLLFDSGQTVPCATVHYQSGTGTDSYLILSNVYKVDTTWKDPQGNPVSFRAFPINPTQTLAEYAEASAIGGKWRLHMAKSQGITDDDYAYIDIYKDARASDRHNINKPNRTHIKDLDNYDAIRKSIAAVLNRASKETVTIGKARTARYPYTKVIARKSVGISRGSGGSSNVISFPTDNVFLDALGQVAGRDARTFGAKKGMVIAQLSKHDGTNSAIVRYAYITALDGTTITYGLLDTGKDTSDGVELDDAEDMAILIPTETGHKVQLKNNLYGVSYDVIVQKIIYTYSPGVISATIEGVGVNTNDAAGAATASSDMINVDIVGGGDDKGYSFNLPEITQKWTFEDGTISPYDENYIELIPHVSGKTTVRLRTIADGKVYNVDVANNTTVAGYGFLRLEIGATDTAEGAHTDFVNSNIDDAGPYAIFFRTKGTLYKSRKLQAIAVKRKPGETSGGKIWSEIQSPHDILVAVAQKDSGGRCVVQVSEGGAFGSGWPMDVSSIGNHRMTTALLKRGAQPWSSDLKFEGVAYNQLKFGHKDTITNDATISFGDNTPYTISNSDFASDPLGNNSTVSSAGVVTLVAGANYFYQDISRTSPSSPVVTASYSDVYQDDRIFLAIVVVSVPYTVGTATQADNIITEGGGAVWTDKMIGSTFKFTAGGEQTVRTITARPSASTLKVNGAAATVGSATAYQITDGSGSPSIFPFNSHIPTMSVAVLTANSIHADHLQASSITADKLEAELVLANTIKTSETVGDTGGNTGFGIKITAADGIQGFDTAGAQQFKIDPATGAAQFGTATVGTIPWSLVGDDDSNKPFNNAEVNPASYGGFSTGDDGKTRLFLGFDSSGDIKRGIKIDSLVALTDGSAAAPTYAGLAASGDSDCIIDKKGIMGFYRQGDDTTIQFYIRADTGAAYLGAGTIKLDANGIIVTQSGDASGYIKSAGKDYGGNAAGWFLGWHGGAVELGGAYKFDIGDANQYLRWSGSALLIGGDIIIGGQTVNVDPEANEVVDPTRFLKWTAPGKTAAFMYRLQSGIEGSAIYETGALIANMYATTVWVDDIVGSVSGNTQLGHYDQPFLAVHTEQLSLNTPNSNDEFITLAVAETTGGSSPSAKYTLTFPADGPTANKLIQTDSSGNLSFVDAASSTDTTYTHTWVDSSTNAILRLTAGGSGSGNDDLTIVAGSNITLTPSGDDLTIAATDTNTVYTHPSHDGDDFNIDTGHLSGAYVVDDIDINVTTDASGHVTDANGTVATRQLTAADIGAAAASHGSHSGEANADDTAIVKRGTYCGDGQEDGQYVVTGLTNISHLIIYEVKDVPTDIDDNRKSGQGKVFEAFEHVHPFGNFDARISAIVETAGDADAARAVFRAKDEKWYGGRVWLNGKQETGLYQYQDGTFTIYDEKDEEVTYFYNDSDSYRPNESLRDYAWVAYGS